ncbi:unnamed protein product, partial [Anisakis simplex]|uniref:Merozoite surface protein 3 n=1 Tax=Anisakis simplex TaxID=6269 RepID=A0A0M3JKM7_ANISI
KINDEKSTPAKETTTGDKEREESRSDESLQTPTRLQQTAEIAKDSSTLPERKSSESAKDSSTAAVAPSTSTDQTNLQTTPSKTANEEHGQELEGEGAKKKVDDDDLKQEEE